jgi:thymidylate kinase
MGFLICLEGLDAVGKNTQSKMLRERFVSEEQDAVLYSFPRYDTPLGKAIRLHLTGGIAFIDNDGESERHVAPESDMIFQCMMMMDRYDAAAEIRRHLDGGAFVVCDRWAPSSVAFGSSDGLDAGWLANTQSSLPRATLNVLISISEEEALKRRPVLRDRYEKDRVKQAVIRKKYEEMWHDGAADVSSAEVWVAVDGMGSVAEVHERIWAIVLRFHLTKLASLASKRG